MLSEAMPIESDVLSYGSCENLAKLKITLRSLFDLESGKVDKKDKHLYLLFSCYLRLFEK